MGTDTAFFKAMQDLEDKVFGSVFGFLNGMISALTGGVMKEWLKEEQTLDGLLGDLAGGLGEAVIKWITDAGKAATDLTVEAFTEINKETMKAIGLATLQDKILRNLEQTMQDRVDHYALIMEGEIVAESSAAESLAAKATALLGEDAGIAVNRATAYMESMESTFSEQSLAMLDHTLAGYDILVDDLKFSFAEIEQQARFGSVSAVAAVTETAQQNIVEFDVWFRDTVAVPIAMGENILRALREAGNYTEDESVENIRAMLIATYRAVSGIDPAELFKGLTP